MGLPDTPGPDPVSDPASDPTSDQRWLVAERLAGAELRFAGRGPRISRRRLLAEAGGAGLELSWCRQVHSARVLTARPGEAGEGDALFTRRTGLALSVAVADCVPVVVAGPDRLAVVHAGWRGIAAGIVRRALDALGGDDGLEAWVGPAIGPCCYEVGDEVAARVAAASGPESVCPGLRDRPHLDLHRAVELQLLESGLAGVRRDDRCTRCHASLLWSYRRDGDGAGRNLVFAWLTSRA